jgi:hypothetical protein
MYDAFINSNNAKFIEQFTDRSLMNTVNQARTGNVNEMSDAI